MVEYGAVGFAVRNCCDIGGDLVFDASVVPLWKPIHDINALPAFGTEESDCLDFKSRPWGPSPGDTAELLRDVAQFANQLGGSLIVGADEESDILRGFMHVTEREKLATRVLDACHSRLSPRVSVSCVALTTPCGHAVLVINVEPSIGPVGIRLHAGRWDFFRRSGKSKRPMEFDEVERMWTEGRRGRIILQQIPPETRGDVYLQLEAFDDTLTRTSVEIHLKDQHINVTSHAKGYSFDVPYEYVRAAWPRTGGGWWLSLTVRLAWDAGASKVVVRYSA